MSWFSNAAASGPRSLFVRPTWHGAPDPTGAQCCIDGLPACDPAFADARVAARRNAESRVLRHRRLARAHKSHARAFWIGSAPVKPHAPVPNVIPTRSVPAPCRGADEPAAAGTRVPRYGHWHGTTIALTRNFGSAQCDSCGVRPAVPAAGAGPPGRMISRPRAGRAPLRPGEKRPKHQTRTHTPSQFPA
jgi:hypothetical protein